MTSIQTKLATEQEQIAHMDDVTEAALAAAVLRWKAASIKGEKGAADELLRADACSPHTRG